MFSNSQADCEYVREVMLSILRSRVSDSRLSTFQAFKLEGGWTNPSAITLYADRNPSLSDDGIRIGFTR
jgi:hypothetical protein